MITKFFLVILILGCSFAIDDRVAKSLFSDFMRTYNKIYNNEIEMERRFETFKTNLNLISNMNLKQKSARFGITKFSDLSPAEFQSVVLMGNFERPKDKKYYPEKLALPTHMDIPTTFDWRDHDAVTPVYDQGQCGSCWAFSATEAIESAWFLAGNTLTSLAPQQIVDCDIGNGDQGCDGGDTPTAYEYVIKAGGLESEVSYPYQGVDENCEFNSKDVVAKIQNWTYVIPTNSRNETQMQIGLMAKGPLSICVDASSWQFYYGGVITECSDNLDHCVMITGFNDVSGWDGETYHVWNIRNSWGSDWGNEGYLYVERGYDLCGVAEEVTLPLVN